MAYRGEDLDLRTPQTWSGSGADLGGAGEMPQVPNGNRSSYRNGPILVDEQLLACCNQAYEVALANRAAEVRVEHLLHAMTRIDQAFGALEARGIRAAALRRETATVVGNDLPTVASSGMTLPRRSEELADVLRRASAQASRHNAPASVDDVIVVLLDYRGEFPSAELLSRFASRPYTLRDAPEPLPPLTRGGFDPRYSPGYGQRQMLEPPRAAYRADIAGTPTDALQNSRIEALEQMLRALSQDFSNERHIIAGLVRDLSRDTQAHQDDQSRRQTTLLDRIGTLEDAMVQSRPAGAPDTGLVGKLESIETALELRLQDMSQSWSVLSKRLQDLEGAVRGQASTGGGISAEDVRRAVDLAPIAHRLDVIEEAVLSKEPSTDAALHDRFGKLEVEIGRALAAAGASAGRFDSMAAGFDRVGGLADKFDTHQDYIAQTVNGLSQRLAAVEQAITAEIETAAAKHQAYTKDLSEVHDALMKLNDNQHTLAGSMDQWRSDQAVDMAGLATRITNLDRDNSKPIEALNAHMDTMNRLLIERYHRRNRFWYWLFGTDDWLGSSWPSQRAAIEAEKERLSASSA